MKHLISFENYNDCIVGDVVKLLWNGAEHHARIVKKKSNNSFIVHIQRNNKFLPKPISVKGTDIIEKVEGVDEPAEGSDWVKFKMGKISNDMAINNYPGNDGGGASVHNIDTSGGLGVAGP
jgi:hypothetical protein